MGAPEILLPCQIPATPGSYTGKHDHNGRFDVLEGPQNMPISGGFPSGTRAPPGGVFDRGCRSLQRGPGPCRGRVLRSASRPPEARPSTGCPVDVPTDERRTYRVRTTVPTYRPTYLKRARARDRRRGRRLGRPWLDSGRGSLSRGRDVRAPGVRSPISPHGRMPRWGTRGAPEEVPAAVH